MGKRDDGTAATGPCMARWRFEAPGPYDMRTLLLAGAAALFATAAFAADPVAPPPPDNGQVITMPVSAAPGETCASLMTKAKGMTLPSDAGKAKYVRNELAAADASNDD